MNIRIDLHKSIYLYSSIIYYRYLSAFPFRLLFFRSGEVGEPPDLQAGSSP